MLKARAARGISCNELISRQVCSQRLLQQPQPAPLDEGTEQINAIGRGHLRLQRTAHTGFTGGIDQQGAVGQGDQGPGQRCFSRQQRRRPQLLQQPGAGVEPIAGRDRFRRLLLQHRHDPVHQGQLLLPLGLRQCRQGDLAELPQVAGQPLRSLGLIEGLQLVEGGQLEDKALVVGFAEGVVVEAGGELLRWHGMGCRQECHSVRGWLQARQGRSMHSLHKTIGIRPLALCIGECFCRSAANT